MSHGRSIRRSWRVALPIGALAAGLLAVAPATVAGATTGTASSLYVSPTGTDAGACPASNPCATINYAESVAATGAVIHVAAGNYSQSVTVNKNVTIDGAGPGTVLDPSTPVSAGNDPDSGYPTWAIIDVTPGTTAKVVNLTVDGTKASAFFNQYGCADDYVGVYYNGASGTLDNVTVNGVQLPTALFGCQDGLGVFVNAPSGDQASVNMANDIVTNYDKNGITCDDAGTSCVISYSTVTGSGPTPLIAQNGIQAYGAAKADINDDTVSQNSYTGGGAGNQATGLLLLDTGTVAAVQNVVSSNDVNVYLGSDGSGPTQGYWTVWQNTISNATDNVPGGQSGYGDGVQIDSITNAGLSLNLNSITGSAENGVSVLSSSDVTVASNTVDSNAGDGIYVGAPGSFSSNFSGHNHVQDNKTSDNGKVGIFADLRSDLNAFKANVSSGNGTFDMENLGLFNSFSQNSCPGGKTFPPGLCS